MRKYLRAIAKANMQAAGIQHPNRRMPGTQGRQGRSYFARNWRKYIK